MRGLRPARRRNAALAVKLVRLLANVDLWLGAHKLSDAATAAAAQYINYIHLGGRTDTSNPN